jgi:hypothetical protein
MLNVGTIHMLVFGYFDLKIILLEVTVAILDRGPFQPSFGYFGMIQLISWQVS